MVYELSLQVRFLGSGLLVGIRACSGEKVRSGYPEWMKRRVATVRKDESDQALEQSVEEVSRERWVAKQARWKRGTQL